MKKAILLIAITLLSFHSSKALITHVEVLTNGKQHLYLLSDWHDDVKGGANTIQQQNDILWAVRQKQGNVFLLAEDDYTAHEKFFIKHSSSFAVDGENEVLSKFPDSIEDFFMKTFEWSLNRYDQAGLHYMVTPLGYLTHFAKQLPGIFVRNVELDTVTRILNAPDKSAILQSLHQYIDKLNPNCDAYRSFLKEGLQVCGETSDEDEFLGHIMQIRKLLVDARILHNFTKLQDVPYGFIAAGATHIQNIKVNLLNIGYRSVDSFGISNDETFAHLSYDEAFIVNNRLDLKATFEKILSSHASPEAGG